METAIHSLLLGIPRALTIWLALIASVAIALMLLSAPSRLSRSSRAARRAAKAARAARRSLAAHGHRAIHESPFGSEDASRREGAFIRAVPTAYEPPATHRRIAGHTSTDSHPRTAYLSAAHRGTGRHASTAVLASTAAPASADRATTVASASRTGSAGRAEVFEVGTFSLGGAAASFSRGRTAAALSRGGPTGGLAQARTAGSPSRGRMAGGLPRGRTAGGLPRGSAAVTSGKPPAPRIGNADTVILSVVRGPVDERRERQYRLAVQAEELRRYAEEVAVAAERAAVTAQRRRSEWLALYRAQEAAWRAYEAIDAATRRLAAASAFPSPRVPLTADELAFRERYLRSAATAAYRRGELSMRQLTDALYGRDGWDSRRPPCEQELLLRQAGRSWLLHEYQATSGIEQTAWQEAETAACAHRSLADEAISASARASLAQSRLSAESRSARARLGDIRQPSLAAS